MAIETWFPLAVYYEDLETPLEVKQRMLDHLAPALEQHLRNPSTGFAYTGDTRSEWQIHESDAFSWLRDRVEHHAVRFAKALGVNLAVMGFYFQRSWPVFTRQGEKVNLHSHPNASLSGVYFLSVGDMEKAGSLIFHNDSRQNALGVGFDTNNTRGITQWNAFNYAQAVYKPQEGRLVLFPAKQLHSVEPNQTDQIRISVSFDIALTCSRHADPGRHEFLQPPPEDWKEFRSQSAPAAYGPIGPARNR
jgi:uncharacterized protein (TIGR02466 family)